MSEYFNNLKNNYVFNYAHYKKSINTKNNFNFTVLFLVIILLLGACVFLRPRTNKMVDFYFIEIDNFQTYQPALNLSQNVNLQGGAGYIYFDGKYHVLASFYSNLDDAESVLKNVTSEYSNACILTISSSAFKPTKNLNSTQNNAVQILLDLTNNLILQLERLTYKFNSNEITFSEMSVHLKTIHDEYYSVYETFISAFKTNSKYNVAKDYTSDMLSSFSNIKTTEEQNVLTSIRFELISIVVNRHHFLSCF